MKRLLPSSRGAFRQNFAPGSVLHLLPALPPLSTPEKVRTDPGAPARPAEGIALIVTLIMLSVITFMAITFLVLSQRERGAVTTNTEQARARLAADTALARAEAELVASMMATSNQFDYGLLVSTNYISPVGYVTGNRSLTNVSYVYQNGKPLNRNDELENLSHLLYDPRPPVFITNEEYLANRALAASNPDLALTNGDALNPVNFRYYLDLNRNGRYDTNGLQPVISPIPALPFYNTNYNVMPQILPGETLSNFFVGDPEWIGGLERPDLPHSPTNRFLFRYAYLVVPAGKTLDLNYIHNYAKSLKPTTMTYGDGFLRNEGVGTWEDNLAAFLVDLNTNMWDNRSAPYVYFPGDMTLPNQGAAFDDAVALLRFRYGANWMTSMPSAAQLFGNPGVNAFRRDFIDDYSRGPVMTGTHLLVDNDPTGVAWPGADNTNHFFTTQDLFDKTKTALGVPNNSLSFSDRLFRAGTQPDSYDRYTFYRLLSQLGTDTSGDEPSGKMNLNYDNLVQRNPYTLALSPTNFIPWTPIEFFTNAANRLLANAGYDTKGVVDPALRVSAGHIQIWPNNLYTPSVHQLLQLAANIYDATTNRILDAAAPLPAAPSVFRPLFADELDHGTNVIVIRGYEEVTNIAQVLPREFGGPIRFLSLVDTNAMKTIHGEDMVYGVPLIVGAKKGLPNFNEFAMQTLIQVTRKLEFRRPSLLSAVDETNQMYTLSISNVFGVEAWNSYSNAYPRPLRMDVDVENFASLTNELGQVFPLRWGTNDDYRKMSIDIPAKDWPGWVDPNYAQQSFKIPFAPATNDFYFLRDSTYSQIRRQFVPLIGVFERNKGDRLGFPVPHWYLNLRTRLRFILIDTALRRVVDYVNLDQQQPPLDIANILQEGANYNAVDDPNPGSMWITNRYGGAWNDISKPTGGIENQIAACLGLSSPVDWTTVPATAPPGLDKDAAIDFFRRQFGLSGLKYPGSMFSVTNTFYAPYVPTRNIYFTTSWEANDPLVHYTVSDLTDPETNNIQFTADNSTITNIGMINIRYEPWGWPNHTGSKTITDMSVKDPLVTRSDDWDFPTNKFPNIGWLGRVHRGTPWQTIDLKSFIPDPSAATNVVKWMKWSGDWILERNLGQFTTNTVPLSLNFYTNDSSFTYPLNDRYILDLFTAAPDDNAARGQLSINQTNLAAWSAVLAGVNVLPDATTNMFIQPAGPYDPRSRSLPPLVRIVQGIINARTNYVGDTFHRLGDILITPELTVKSPFLDGNTGLQNDEVLERIPQQILGLLKGGGDPRFVIYAYGQALKPADRSLVTSGPYFGLCTNYQITAEMATRAVVRIEGGPTYPHPLSRQPPLNNLHAVVESFNVLPPDQ